MKPEDIIASEDFQKCVAFHGHLCPGLTMGYKASVAGLEWLKAHRSVDEEIVAIVETDACGADAVQVMTGCTFGKGNLIYKDRGKQVLILAGRGSGRLAGRVRALQAARTASRRAMRQTHAQNASGRRSERSFA